MVCFIAMFYISFGRQKRFEQIRMLGSLRKKSKSMEVLTKNRLFWQMGSFANLYIDLQIQQQKMSTQWVDHVNVVWWIWNLSKSTCSTFSSKLYVPVVRSTLLGRWDREFCRGSTSEITFLMSWWRESLRYLYKVFPSKTETKLQIALSQWSRRVERAIGA